MRHVTSHRGIFVVVLGWFVFVVVVLFFVFGGWGCSCCFVCLFVSMFVFRAGMVAWPGEVISVG